MLCSWRSQTIVISPYILTGKRHEYLTQKCSSAIVSSDLQFRSRLLFPGPSPDLREFLAAAPDPAPAAAIIRPARKLHLARRRHQQHQQQDD